MIKKIALVAVIFIIAATAAFYFFKTSFGESDASLVVPVKKGSFVISVTTSGELEAKNSTKITGPSGVDRFQIWEIKIDDILPEGSLVKKGDYVAALDKSQILGKLKESEIELQKMISHHTSAQLDTSLALRQARDELVNLAYVTKEQRIILEQSQYEPPATIRQVEMSLEKADRALEQAKENYKIKKRQAITRMEEANAYLKQEKQRFEQIQEIIQKFTIMAPEDGMLIYDRDWSGRKKTKGSMIQMWMPVVATLPDFNVMLSETYVNEVDIRKIKTGQKVNIGLDAFPEKKLSGKVISVANVGEQRPNSDAKVFQVQIEIAKKDTILRPGMTTSNVIIAESLKDIIHVPLECIHNSDTITYVFKKDGINVLKQQVYVGRTNENEAEIVAGLDLKDEVYLSIPQGSEDKKIIYLKKRKSATLPAKVE